MTTSVNLSHSDSTNNTLKISVTVSFDEIKTTDNVEDIQKVLKVVNDSIIEAVKEKQSQKQDRKGRFL